MSDKAKSVEVVGIQSPGDMGHAIARVLKAQGKQVISCLEGRSRRTIELADKAGIIAVESIEELVLRADVLLSILVPAQAEVAAERVVQAVADTKSQLHFVECNAIAPETVRRIADRLTSVEARFSDGAIIGFPPGVAAAPRLYVAGPDAASLMALDGGGVIVKVVGDQIGQASALKMCYAALTKGTFALEFALLLVAERLHMLNPLLAEFESSQATVYKHMREALPRLPAKSGRWVGEMQEIAATFEQAGMAPEFFHAAADVFQHISRSRLGQETPETIDTSRTLERTIAILAQTDQKPF